MIRRSYPALSISQLMICILVGMLAKPMTPTEAALHRTVAIPAAFAKTIHFIRHGQAFSNVAGEKDHAAYSSEEWFDASLTPNGWKQAEALGKHIRDVGLRPQLVVVSPLTRALQTACAAFGSPVPEEGLQSKPLMTAFEGIPGHQVERKPISSQGAPPFIAHELCREHLGVHPCDRRRDTAYYREHFPAIDFSLITDEYDKMWLPDERESRESIKQRGAAVIQWLMSRPEREIAVVAHSSFLHFTLTNFAHRPGLPEAAVAEYTRWFENCELRTIVLADLSQPLMTPYTDHFPGGQRALSISETVNGKYK